MPTTPRVLALAVRPAPAVAVAELGEARAVAGGGLEGDHGGRGDRGITLLDLGAWTRACEEVGEALPWTARRANVLVGGVDLGALVGLRVRLGEVEVLVVGETRPCGVMDRARPGLRRALEPDVRGGVHGRIVTSGVVRVGDPVIGEA